MALIISITVVFLALLFLPFAVSLLSLRKSKDVSLYVKSDNVRDPRYFSNSFRSLVEKGIDPQTRTITMSKSEPFVYARELQDTVCDCIVVAQSHFQPVGVACFAKEIYAASSVQIPPHTSLRAIACLDRLEIGQNCEVVRWADSDGQMTVAAGCALGMSISSGERLLIAKGCTFRRFYSPEIIIGSSLVRPKHTPTDTAISSERLINPESIGVHETVNSTIVTEYSLSIGESAVIMGSIKSNHHVYVHRNARINGNLVADGIIILEEGARVLGSVFSQDSVLVGPGVEIGVKRKIKSLIARKSIVLCETAMVFGYVGCETDSKTIAKEDFHAELSQKQWATKMENLVAEIAEEQDDDEARYAFDHSAYSEPIDRFFPDEPQSGEPIGDQAQEGEGQRNKKRRNTKSTGSPSGGAEEDEDDFSLFN